MPSLQVILAALTGVSFLLVVAVHNQVTAVAAVLLLGVAGAATIAPLQIRMLNKADGAPTMASAANIAAFNVGNTIGPLLGASALGVTAVSAGLDRRSPRRALRMPDDGRGGIRCESGAVPQL